MNLGTSCGGFREFGIGLVHKCQPPFLLSEAALREAPPSDQEVRAPPPRDPQVPGAFGCAAAAGSGRAAEEPTLKRPQAFEALRAKKEAASAESRL